MARAGSINFQVSKIIKQINGISKSKLENRNESGLIGESGHKVSNLVHSYKSLDNIRTDITNLAKFAKAEYKIKDISKIDSEVVRNWIENKDIGYRTASNYLSQINKVVTHLNVTKEDVKNIRQEFKKLEKPKNETRYYKKLNKIELPTRSQPAFELQRDYGLRMSAATHVNIQKQINGTTLKYQEKGGKWNERELSDSLLLKIKENSVDGIYNINNRTYARDLKKEIEKSNQVYNGTHGIRHSYAQDQLMQGKTKQEVSNAMGHNREKIMDEYLR